MQGASVAVVVSWSALLASALSGPLLAAPDDPGDALTRYTVRVALVYYAAAVSLLLWPGGSWRLARLCWTLGWASYLVHLAMAFQHYHHWSHADAIEHTRTVSGVGEGIYVSHLFTLLWTVDVVWWWLRSVTYASRPVWLNGVLHGFMFFIVFNATVVYEKGFIRWAGAALTAWLLGLVLLRVACRGDREAVTTEGRPTEAPESSHGATP